MTADPREILYIDERGYSLCVDRSTGLYSAGCHTDMTRAEAIAHWSDPEYANRDRGDAFVAAIERDEPLTELPARLAELHIHAPLPAGSKLPARLQYLYLYVPLAAGTELPAGLLRLSLRVPLPAGTVLPAGLRWLYLHAPLPEGTIIPSGTRVYR